VTPPAPKLEPPEPKIEVEPPKPEPAPAPTEPEAAKQEPPTASKPVTPEARTPNQGEFQPGTQIASNRRPNELPAPRRPAQPDPKPKLEFEAPAASAPGRESERIKLGDLTLNRRPDQVIEGAVRNLSQSGGVRQAVGDTYGTGGMGGYLPPSPGNQGSDVELLSDPQGVDFRPYLLTVLASVRRNWYAVIPESARLAITRGKTTIQFAIVRTGSVSKLVIANSSGTQSLDRAAVAGISASNPFPPLPAEFPGSDVRLQFVFLYNVKTK
jgi:TonB family protein